MKRLLHFLRQEEEAATAVEYAVMLALIVVFCVASIRFFGESTRDSFDDTANQINTFFSGS